MAKFPYKNILEGVKHIWTKSQGPDAEGAAVTANPLTIGYKDASGNATGVTPTEALPVGDATAQATLAAIQDYVDGLEIALGEVDANPTAYTVLARLKDLATTIGAVAADPAANTLLARIKALETKVDAIIADGIKLSGNKACLSTEQKPAGQQNDTLLEYNPTTKETKVYKYISGDWREL